MKKLISLFVILFAVSLSFAQKAGDKIQFTAQDLNGNSFSSEHFLQNKITMLNIWGTFCPPCIKEMPDLAKLNSENKANGFEIIGIVIDLTDRNGNILQKQKNDADLIIKSTGADYTHLVPGPEMNTFLKNIQVVPTSIFVDKNGKIIGQMYLGAKSKKDWQKIIDTLLKNQ